MNNTAIIYADSLDQAGSHDLIVVGTNQAGVSAMSEWRIIIDDEVGNEGEEVEGLPFRIDDVEVQVGESVEIELPSVELVDLDGPSLKFDKRLDMEIVDQVSEYLVRVSP